MLTLSRRLAIPVLLSAALVGGATAAPAAAATRPDMERCVISHVNAERARRGHRPLAMRSPLREAARIRARSMARGGYFAHVSPAGVDAWDVLTRLGRRVRDLSEAIGRNYGYSPRASCLRMVRWWMNSTAHRHLLMKPSRRIAGVGVVRQGTHTWLVVLPAAKQWRR